MLGFSSISGTALSALPQTVISASVSLPGVTGTAQIGTFHVANSYAPSGTVATASVGSLGTTAVYTASIIGVAGIAGVGVITPSFPATTAIVGVQGSAAVGTTLYGITMPLSGQVGTMALGHLHTSVTTALIGVQGISAFATVGSLASKRATITSAGSTAHIGALTPNSLNPQSPHPSPMHGVIRANAHAEAVEIDTGAHIQRILTSRLRYDIAHLSESRSIPSVQTTAHAGTLAKLIDHALIGVTGTGMIGTVRGGAFSVSSAVVIFNVISHGNVGDLTIHTHRTPTAITTIMT